MQVFSQFDEPLRNVWDAALAQDPLASMPFMTFAWHAHWFTYFGNDEHLSIFADPTANIILPMSIAGGVAHFSGGEEIADYLDAVGAVDRKIDAWKVTLPMLKERGATSLILRNIPEDSPTLDFFRTLPQTEITTEDTTPILPLPASCDEYLSALDRKDRHELKRKMRKFETEHQSLTFTVHENSEINLSSLFELMRYDTDKVAFLTPDMIGFFENLPAIFPDTIRQFVLSDGDNVIASTLAFRTPGALLLYNSGFNPRYPGAGWYIKVKTIAWAIDQNITAYNFLQGNERYKYDLGGIDHQVYRVTANLTGITDR